MGDFQESEFEPLPEESGALQPPRRDPPTAVGTMDVPPPRRFGDEPYSRGPTAVRRIALRLLALLLSSCAGALLWPLGWRGFAAALVLLLAQTVWMGARARRLARSLHRGGESKGQPLARSA